MSASPSKEPEVEQEAQSGEDQEHMDKDQEQTQNQGEFEVKEQDRWLPIANGQLRSLAASLVLLICAYLTSNCWPTAVCPTSL